MYHPDGTTLNRRRWPWTVAPDGTVYGVRASYAYPGEVVRIDGDSVTRLPNPVERPELPGTLVEVETTSADGVRIRGWLALPHGASPEKPAPLLLWIHGGPLSSWNAWSWRWTPWAMVAQGYAVLLPDPALSTGYGQDFIQRGWGSWGDAPYTDLMAITDAVEARDDIHGDKDYRVPIGEGLRLWWELLSKSGLPADEKGQSPHRFLYFPDENHWILQPQHALVWYEVVLGFIGEHVHGRTPTLPATLGLRDAATP